MFLPHAPERLLVTIDHVCLEPQEVAWCQHARRGSKDGTSAKMASQASTLQGSGKELLLGVASGNSPTISLGKNRNTKILWNSVSHPLSLVFGLAVPYFAVQAKRQDARGP